MQDRPVEPGLARLQDEEHLLELSFEPVCGATNS